MMRSQIKATPEPILPAHIKLPRPDQFGLAANFNAEEYLARWNKQKEIRERIMAVVAYVATFIPLVYLLRPDRDPPVPLSDISQYIYPAWFALLGCGVLLWVFKEAYAHLFREHQNPDVHAYIDALAVYRDKLRDWNERQTETGRTYWKEKRGVAFEEAVRALLSRRGCKVQTTKGSGDGGIDLIAMFGGSTFWCQCKGHQSPVGVAVVREIAGVCSRGGGVPVVIAVNGYTKAAVETAQQLGVLLIDTHNLVNMAKQQRLSQWN